LIHSFIHSFSSLSRDRSKASSPHSAIYSFLRQKEYLLEWRPSGRRKRGTPKLTGAEGIRGMMGEKGLQEEDRADRNNWRRKIA
jgi:hypothetical protein